MRFDGNGDEPRSQSGRGVKNGSSWGEFVAVINLVHLELTGVRCRKEPSPVDLGLGSVFPVIQQELIQVVKPERVSTGAGPWFKSKIEKSLYIC